MKTILPIPKTIAMAMMAVMLGMIFSTGITQARETPYRIGVLMSMDARNLPLSGLKEGLTQLGLVEGKNIQFNIKNAKGDRKKLLDLAQDIIQSKPDVAVATGGVEADALKIASKDTEVPIIFLAAASTVDRKLVESLKNPGGNMTGLDTNDTELTAKRLWLIKKILPEAKQVLIFYSPIIESSLKSAEVAKKNADRLGFRLQTVLVETKEDLEKAMTSIAWNDVDVILLTPHAVVKQTLKKLVLPISLAHKIPIFGYGAGFIKKGAVFSYAGSRYEAAVQAARLVNKVLQGVKPSDIPVEPPKRIELIINRWMVDQLDLKLSGRTWKLADKVLETKIK